MQSFLFQPLLASASFQQPFNHFMLLAGRSKSFLHNLLLQAPNQSRIDAFDDGDSAHVIHVFAVQCKCSLMHAPFYTKAPIHPFTACIYFLRGHYALTLFKSPRFLNRLYTLRRWSHVQTN